MRDNAAYFQALSRALDAAGECSPRLIIDATRLDENAQKIAAAAAGRNLRIVDKSLPSEALLRRIAGMTGARDFMSFHWPYVIQTARAFPDANILIGKPMPVGAVEKIFAALAGTAFDPARQIIWLVDTERRARDYAATVRRLGAVLSVAIEIDIGMRRGGASTVDALKSLLRDILSAPDALRFSGFMGYDAHVAKAQKAIRNPLRALRLANARYQTFIDEASADGVSLDNLILNGAGSPTLTLHGADSPLNDVSVGSAFVKPSGFDLPTLAELKPAAFIATPVLKREKGVRVPFIEALTRRWSRNRDTIFIYGGRWMASPVWPEGMSENSLYGLSSNQQMMTVPKTARSRPGGWAFLRPTQSEAVLTQFGDLRVFEGGRIADRWPVYCEETEPNGAGCARSMLKEKIGAA